MINEFEKLLKWFIPLFVIQWFLANGLISIAALLLEQEQDTVSVIAWASAVSPWVNIATHALVGLWLYKMAKKLNYKAAYWGTFGVFTGLISIVVFFAMQIYDQNQQKHKQSSNMDTAGTSS